MVTDPILNNSEFQTIFNFTEKSYLEFYKLQKNGKLVMEELKKSIVPALTLKIK